MRCRHSFRMLRRSGPSDAVPESPPRMSNPAHPDRLIATLAQRTAMPSATDACEPNADHVPGDARVDVALLLWRARRALATRGTPAARARFAAIDAPQLLAGTVQDGVARGVLVALEETISLCSGSESLPAESLPADDGAERFVDRDLRRKKDIVVASRGARVRWSRKGGVLFVDREHDVHEEDCIRFEDRSDRGDLDAFAQDPAERARLFSPAFLRPVLLVHGPTQHRLELAGRLGRRADGFPCTLVFLARPDEDFVRLIVRVRNTHDDHRLRIRFLGCRRVDAIESDGTPGFVAVHHDARHFVAATLVRACGRLRVGESSIAVPGAQCHAELRHEFRLGGRPWRESVSLAHDASKDR